MGVRPTRTAYCPALTSVLQRSARQPSSADSSFSSPVMVAWIIAARIRAGSCRHEFSPVLPVLDGVFPTAKDRRVRGLDLRFAVCSPSICV